MVWHRSGKQYYDAYHSKSMPIIFPIPATMPGYKSDAPIHLKSKMEGVRPAHPEDLDSERLMPMAKSLVSTQADLSERETITCAAADTASHLDFSGVLEPLENMLACKWRCLHAYIRASKMRGWLDFAERILELQTGKQPTTVPIFQGAHAAGAPKNAYPQDVLFFAGGPVWGLDWLPSTADAHGLEAATQYVAVSILKGSLEIPFLLEHHFSFFPSLLNRISFF